MALKRDPSRPDAPCTAMARGRSDASAHASPDSSDPPASGNDASEPSVPPAAADASPRPSYPAWRVVCALLLAAASDLIGGGIDSTIAGVPATIPLDIATALALWATLGRPALLLVALVAEALPGVGVLPLWTAVVIAIAMTGGVPGRAAR